MPVQTVISAHSREVAPLRPSDSCEATASGVERAVVRVATEDGVRVLDFCAHHFGKLELGLLQHGFSVRHDVRTVLSASYR